METMYACEQDKVSKTSWIAIERYFYLIAKCTHIWEQSEANAGGVGDQTYKPSPESQ